MPKVGNLGIDMMIRTCTIQVNLDYSDEPDMQMKTLLSVKIQPIITALFANSPLSMGKPNGFLSKKECVRAKVKILKLPNSSPSLCDNVKVKVHAKEVLKTLENILKK